MKSRDNWKWLRRAFKTLGSTFLFTFGVGVWEITDLSRQTETLKSSFEYCRDKKWPWIVPAALITSSPIGCGGFHLGRRINKRRD